jgi:hypothetical protein
VSPSPSESDGNHVTKVSQRGKKKKTKSRLSNALSDASLNRSHNDSVRSARSAPISTGASASRRRRRSASPSDELEGQESRFEARFNASGLEPSAEGAADFADHLTSSSRTSLDDDEASDDGDLHDFKVNPVDNSPYAQVRASVAATDNLTLSIDTPRMWILSILFAIAGSSTNLFFSLRYPSVSLTPIIALLLVHPIGLFWDRLLKRHDDPEEIFINGCLQRSPRSHLPWRRRFRLWLAKGRWNEKEHCCVYVSSNVSFGFAFATDVSTSPTRLWILANVNTGHRRTSQVLSPRSRDSLPGATYPLHTDPGVLARRTHAPLSRSTEWHDLAKHSCVNCHVHCPTQRREQTSRRVDNFTSQVLCSRILRLGRVLLPPRSPLPSSELLQCHHLVCAQECRGR